MLRRLLLTGLLALLPGVAAAGEKAPLWVTYPGGDGPGKGKHIVLVSGDEEYRSEEALPQLAKILSQRHGFKCTVLFAIDKKTGTINPNQNDNIPGLDQLKTADLAIFALRWRNLPDEQMKPIVEYVESGKPIIGLRTSTHAFLLKSKTYHKYTWDNRDAGYEKGFGRQVLGETWVAHHGAHGSESTRGIIAKGQEDNPILRGIKDGDIWGPTDVYTARPPADSTILVLGQVLKGMKDSDAPVAGKKNDPMMPIAWTRHYKTTSGKTARVFTTTMGASEDFAAAGTRRLVVNAVYWALGMENEIPPGGTNAETVGIFHPSPFGNNRFQKNLRPADLAK
jgi:type 1 glutamine amidotransferase